MSDKMKSITVSRYFEIIHPEYVYLRLIPLKSIRNYDSDKIVLAIASMYQNILQRIRRQNSKYFFHVAPRVSYYIYIEKNRVEFFFIVPKDYLTLIKDKIVDTWHGITIQAVVAVPTLPPEATRYFLTYRKEDALSLAADHRSNVLLTSLMSTIDIMEDGDKVALMYNFSPCDQQTWRSAYDRTIDKIKQGLPIDRDKAGVGFALRMLSVALTKLSDFMTDVFMDFTGDSDSKIKTALEPVVVMPATRTKRDARVVKAQIVALSSSPDRNRERNNVVALGEAYRSISADNELVYHRIPMTIKTLTEPYRGADTLKMTAAECSNFVALPGRELLERYNVVERIDVLESEVPAELRQGAVCIGSNTYRGRNQPAYLTTDKEYQHLALVIAGPTRAGKTTLISNISNGSLNAQQCVIIFDFCGNCELSSELAALFPNNRLVIDCADFSHLQGLGYNEANPDEPDLFLRYRNAKIQAVQLLTLINCIMDEKSDLSPKMDRYLECASIVAFMSGGSIRDVFQILLSHIVRHKFIDSAPPEQTDNLAEYVGGLEELDEIDKKDRTVTGTKGSPAISGIIDRINRLKQNTYLELMLKKGCCGNFNLVEEMQKPQLICLRMPDHMFSSEKEKDIYSSYWMTKIWLALQIRKRDHEVRTNVNIVVDELYQVPSCQDFIRSKLSQMAKFSAKMIISCHYLGQIKIIRNELKAANSSYILISGSDKDNFEELKQELAPYEVEDVIGLKRYHALCCLKYEDGYAKFVVKMPPPIMKG
jgi:hypothetical protein